MMIEQLNSIFPKGDQVYKLMLWKFLQKFGIVKLETKSVSQMALMINNGNPSSLIPKGAYIMPIIGMAVEYVVPVSRNEPAS